MPAILLRYLPHLLGALAVVGLLSWGAYSLYSHGEAAGRAIVQKQWDDATSELARQRALQDAETRAKMERDSRIAKEIQDALQQKLDSADARGRDLARRLLDYQARIAALQLSRPADPATGADGTPGVPEDGGAVGQALEEHLAACGRDAERLAGWQEWWARVQ